MDCSFARLLCPWDFRGKNTGVGWHSLLQDLPDPGIEPTSLTFPVLAGRFFTTWPPIFKLLLISGYEKEFMNFLKETNEQKYL